MTAGAARRQFLSHAVRQAGERLNVLLPRITGFVLDKWKVIYVVTPKAMCTSMQWLMVGLQNEDLDRDVSHSRALEVTRGLAVHDPATWRGTRQLHLLPEDDMEQVTSDDGWFRFGFTRHPVDRLWSAWQSKLLLREPTPAAMYGTARWFPRTRGSYPKELPPSTPSSRTSKASLLLLPRTRDFLVGDRHWAPQSYLLRPEGFPYSDIGRVDAAGVTLGRLEGHLRAQGWQGTLELKRLNATLLPRTVIRDPALPRQIEKIYADDMITFGYEPRRRPSTFCRCQRSYGASTGRAGRSA